jgi:hypothetical protein
LEREEYANEPGEYPGGEQYDMANLKGIPFKTKQIEDIPWM